MGQLIQMFSHPVITIDDFPELDAIADKFYDKAMQLKAEYPDAGLISDAWHSGQRAKSPQDIEQHGFTSFYNVNLVKRPDFEFMNRAAMAVFGEYMRVVGKPEVGMHLGSAWASIYGR